jgi:hypothetical protein
MQQPKHSLSDEAQWMSKHRSSAFDAGKKLRHLKIEFVSAGCLEGTIKEMMPALPEETTEDHAESASPALDSNAMASMTIRSPSPAPSTSSSSEDEIVFKGRGGTSAPSTSAPAAAAEETLDAIATNTVQTEASVSIMPIRERSDNGMPPLTAASSDGRSVSPVRTAQPEPTAPIAEPEIAQSDQSDAESVVEDAFQARLGGQTPWMTNTTPWESRSKPGVGWLPVSDRSNKAAFLAGQSNAHAAAMDDYAQNLQDYGEEEDDALPTTFTGRPLDLSDNNGWNTDTLQDFDALSTSSEAVDNIERIMSVRMRKNMLQYLVVYEGSTVDQARWRPATILTSSADLALIESFEAAHPSPSPDMDPTSDSDSERSADSEDDGEDEDEDDPAEEMDDERIARVLQKQEELGIFGDDIVLFGADEYFDSPSNKTTPYGRYTTPKKRQPRSKPSGGRSGPSFPSASALADAVDADPYNGFDVMDTERPSLKIKKKGRRGQMPPELDDPELNETMQATWAADREKKRLKKAEREEMRKQGLLGRKGKAPDLGVKYKDGIDFNSTVEEIRDFMFSDKQSLSLPPMVAHHRAVIHAMVHQLGVSSRSRGDGANRFTVISKTKATRNVDDDFFDSLISGKKFKRRFQNVPGQSPRQYDKNARPQVSYKDGEVVGAAAPELGVENKGRQLLEKMGWTKGTALGALDNKGIMQPIMHVVKTSKAGLQ